MALCYDKGSVTLLLLFLFIFPATTQLSSFLDTLPDDLRPLLTKRCGSLQDGEDEKILCYMKEAMEVQAQNHTISRPFNTSQTHASCKFKKENGWRLHRYRRPPSQHLEQVMESYMSMHRRCTSLELHNLTELLKTGKPTQCRYFIWGHGRYGLGNKLLSLMSSFLYAILSGRVFLVHMPEWPSLFCHPFEGSNFVLGPTRDTNYEKIGVSYLGFRGMGCGARARAGAGANAKVDDKCSSVKVVNLGLLHIAPGAEQEFLVCPDGYSRLRNVKVVTSTNSNQYYATPFFANPALSSVLRLLFPEINPFHVLSQYLYVPSDGMWDDIKLHSQGSEGARRIGVQFREFKNAYTDLYDTMAMSCVQSHAGLCEETVRENEGANVSVYAASLVKKHINTLQSMMNEKVGKKVRFHMQEGVDSYERHDLVQEKEAFLDMWMLSTSDVLMTSPVSTFGYIAQALGGIVPYQLAGWLQECLQLEWYDPCYHYGPVNTVCTTEDGTSVKAVEMFNQSGLMKPCPDKSKTGWQLVPR